MNPDTSSAETSSSKVIDSMYGPINSCIKSNSFSFDPFRVTITMKMGWGKQKMMKYEEDVNKETKKA